MESAPGSGDADQVLVRWIEVPSAAVATVARWHAGLDAAERARADRFRFAADRDAYVTAHALRRALLTQAFDLPRSAWQFVRGPYGKPEIDPALGVRARVNLSHTRGLAAVAVCAAHAVGIDVEGCEDRTDGGLALAERYFCPSEIALLHACHPDRTLEQFVRLWTLKEAYLKATGQGLTRSLHSVAFALDPVRVTFPADAADDPGHWQFFEARPTGAHRLAVAVQRAADHPGSLDARAVARDEI